MRKFNDLTLDDCIFLHEEVGFAFVLEDGEVKDAIQES